MFWICIPHFLDEKPPNIFVSCYNSKPKTTRTANPKLIYFSPNLFFRFNVYNKLNFIYFPTIDKPVLQLILISLVGTNVSARGVIGVGGSRSSWRKPTCPYNHCQTNSDRSGEKRVLYPLLKKSLTNFFSKPI